MDQILESMLSNYSPEFRREFIVNANRMKLNKKAHIKKYNKLRILHSEIIDSMEYYIKHNQYEDDEFLKDVFDEIRKKHEEISLDYDDLDDKTILNELLIYKNHPNLPTITEKYIEKGKFKKNEKIKMLVSMKNSYVGLFKIIETDFEDGYVTYEDVFTKKQFKIIDISMSSTVKIDKNRMVYYYNRVITYDDISFGTGIHCIMTSSNKELMKFIKNHKYDDCSVFARCLMLYDICKKEKNINTKFNNQYGNRR